MAMRIGAGARSERSGVDLASTNTPEQVVRKLATADRMLNDGKDVADVCRELQHGPLMNETGGVEVM
jgi:hypothetical protein